MVHDAGKHGANTGNKENESQDGKNGVVGNKQSCAQSAYDEAYSGFFCQLWSFCLWCGGVMVGV